MNKGQRASERLFNIIIRAASTQKISDGPVDKLLSYDI
jgi:hypothetical protein